MQCYCEVPLFQPQTKCVQSWTPTGAIYCNAKEAPLSRDWVGSDTECFREYNLAEEVILRDHVWSREVVLVNSRISFRKGVGQPPTF